MKTLLRQMQLAQQCIPYTSDYRRALHRKFVAMRVYNGASVIFWTLNPADTKHTFTISFASPESAGWPDHVIDLEADDDAQARFRGQLTSLQIHEVVANDPVAATRCFHTLVQLVITVLLNCTIDPKKLHPDGVASGDMPGVFDYISSICGVVEPQMRRALHLHALISSLGFSTPEDLRSKLTADFDAVVLRMWKWITSVQFTSPEAYAVYLNEDSAMQALKTAPLVPFTEKQVNMIGPKRVLESTRAQLQARGMEEPCPEERSRKIKFPPWQLDFYGNSKLSASEWAERSCLDNLAATQKIGNHSCIPEVCHKGRIGQQGFCRMSYWFWAWVRREGKSLWKRFHGKRLIPRWMPVNTSEQPPIDCVPPNLGLAQSEQTMPFVTKSNPSMYGGPRNNHDVGVLLRCPVDIQRQAFCKIIAPDSECVADARIDLSADREHAKSIREEEKKTADDPVPATGGCSDDGSPSESSEAQEALRARVDQALSDLASAVNNADYYCSDYSTKEQPRLVSLWITLAGSIKKLKEELRDTSLKEEHKDVLYRAKRSVFRLMTSSTQGMQKGMPEMVSFLLGEKEFYCSHDFSSLYLRPLVRLARAELSAGPADEAVCEDDKEGVGDMAAESFSLVRVDEEENDKLTFLNQRLNYGYRPHILESWPLYFYVAGTIIHKKSASTLEIRTYEEFLAEHPQAKSHHVSVRAHIPWVIPEIVGSLPRERRTILSCTL